MALRKKISEKSIEKEPYFGDKVTHFTCTLA